MPSLSSLESSLPSLWSVPFHLHAFALISLCPIKLRLSPTLTLSPLIIWYSGLTALFFFFLAKMTPAFLITAFSMALRPLPPFQQSQYAQVFLLKPAPFCTLFAGRGSTNKSAIFLLYFFYLTLVLSSSPCSLLHLSFFLKNLARTVFSLILFYQLAMGPRTLVSPGERRG